MAKFFVARWQQYTVRLEVPPSAPMDTPDHRARLLRRMGELIVRNITNEVRFTNE